MWPYRGRAKSIKKTMKIALYGGAFDPFHLGHDLVVRTLRQYFDEVWVLLDIKHPYGKKMAPYELRVQMVKNLVRDLPDVYVFGKGKATFFDFLTNEFSGVYGVEYSMVVGLDEALDVDRWHEGQRVIDMIPFVVVGRAGYDAGGSEWFHRSPHQFIPLNSSVSSFQIRSRLKKGFMVEDMVGVSNNRFIREKRLYR